MDAQELSHVNVVDTILEDIWARERAMMKIPDICVCDVACEHLKKLVLWLKYGSLFPKERYIPALVQVLDLAMELSLQKPLIAEDI
jgi:hypothetical protein